MTKKYIFLLKIVKNSGHKLKLLKTAAIWKFFVNFWVSPIQNCYVQIKTVKERIFSFQLKNYFEMVTLNVSIPDNMRKNLWRNHQEV